jgi:hypothetical protein
MDQEWDMAMPKQSYEGASLSRVRLKLHDRRRDLSMRNQFQCIPGRHAGHLGTGALELGWER